MIHIVTDTTCGIPLPDLEAAGISFVPQIITFGDTAYRDDFELTTEMFLEKLKAAKTLPGTAAPPPALYQPIYEKHLAAGDTILVITPSEKVSGTFRSATVAAEEFKTDRIHVLDSKTIAGGFGSLVLQAKAWADAGMEIEEIKHQVVAMASRERVFFLVPTLEYLHKGGRIGKASKLIGTLLQIKPILTVTDGMVDTYDKVRTFKQAMATIEQIDYEIGKDNPDAHLTISHCGAEEEALKLASALGERLNSNHIPIYLVPPAIVVHAGPGVLSTSIFARA